MNTCQVCGQVSAAPIQGPCNTRCARIRREANGEAMRLFEPVATIPGQIAIAEGEPDG